ncbi:MAG: UDP-N-acetylglucosamine 2-epimerase [Phycisphaerales bacterium]|nr:UDP-N-acetylglucosamine 2-epimerase [Phycisphaerales bacterium]
MIPRRILVMTGSRAEYGLLRPILDAFDRDPVLEPLLAVGGSHLLGRNPTIDEIRGERVVDAVIPMQSEDHVTRVDDARALALGVQGFAETIDRLQPDIVLVLGDRLEVFAAASAASLSGVRIAHLHGGDVASGVADESMRHAITKLAHLHFPATPLSASRIRMMGEDPGSIFTVGSPAVDGLDAMPPLSDARWREFGAPRFAVMLHGTGGGSADEFAGATSVLEAVSERGPTVVFEPNRDVGRSGIMNAIERSGLFMIDHLERPAFVGLLQRLDALVGNSSAGLIECAALGVPAVDVGDRQSGRERPHTALHVSCLTGRELHGALDEIGSVAARGRDPRFGDGNAGERVAGLLACLDLDSVRPRKRWHAPRGG